MFRTIVVGYDGPEGGVDAIALAERLRDPRKGTLLLASAYPVSAIPDEPIGMAERRDALEQQAHVSLSEARERLSADVPARVAVVPATSPARALTELAERESADLVVVGSTHRGRLGRVVPGTTAERLLQGAPCAVAVAPRGYAGGDVRHLGVAYDGSPEAEAALDTAEAIALEFGAALTCYCVVEPAGWADSMIAAGTGAEWAVRGRQAPCAAAPLCGRGPCARGPQAGHAAAARAARGGDRPDRPRLLQGLRTVHRRVTVRSDRDDTGGDLT